MRKISRTLSQTAKIEEVICQLKEFIPGSKSSNSIFKHKMEAIRHLVAACEKPYCVNSNVSTIKVTSTAFPEYYREWILGTREDEIAKSILRLLEFNHYKLGLTYEIISYGEGSELTYFGTKSDSGDQEVFCGLIELVLDDIHVAIVGVVDYCIKMNIDIVLFCKCVKAYGEQSK